MGAPRGVARFVVDATTRGSVVECLDPRPQMSTMGAPRGVARFVVEVTTRGSVVKCLDPRPGGVLGFWSSDLSSED